MKTIIILSLIFSFSNVYASEISGVFNSNGNLNSSIIGTVTAPTITSNPTPTPAPSSSGGSSSGWSNSINNSVSNNINQTINNNLNTKTTSSYSRDLQLGSSGQDVKALQILLNSLGFYVAKSGPGSVGNETTLFGPATKNALMQFQKAKKITATGYFGPKTREGIVIFDNVESTVSVPKNTQITSVSDREKDLQLGSSGQDVKALQILLNSLGFYVAKSGPGSVGNETTLFGPATKNALMQFQKAKKITATGYFGPKTREVLNKK